MLYFGLGLCRLPYIGKCIGMFSCIDVSPHADIGGYKFLEHRALISSAGLENP